MLSLTGMLGTHVRSCQHVARVSLGGDPFFSLWFHVLSVRLYSFRAHSPTVPPWGPPADQPFCLPSTLSVRMMISCLRSEIESAGFALSVCSRLRLLVLWRLRLGGSCVFGERDLEGLWLR